MTKLKNPLLSLGAIGRLTKAITFTRRRSADIAEKTPIVPDQKTLAQLSWRHMYQKAIALWHALSAAEKQEWESLARPKHMTGFAWFISQALKPNPGLYLPLQGGTMTGNIDMAKHRLLKLPAPTDAQEAATKTYVDTLIAASLYTQGARAYHNINQSIPNTTWTTVAFNSERYDTDAIHDPVTNNSRLTCKTAGKYIILASLYFIDNATGRRLYDLKVNGNIIIARVEVIPPASPGTPAIVISSIWPLAVNDYVEALAYQSSGGALALPFVAQLTPEFMMQRIG